MKFFKLKNFFKIVSNLKFGILVLALIAFLSSFGSFIEQDEPIIKKIMKKQFMDLLIQILF